MNMPKKQLTTGDVAKRLSVTTRTVQLWINEGLLRAAIVTPGGHRRILPEDFEKFLVESNISQKKNDAFIEEYAIRIVLADKNPLNQQLFQATINSWGIGAKIEIVNDAFSAVTSLSNSKPHIFIADIDTEVMSPSVFLSFIGNHVNANNIHVVAYSSTCMEALAKSGATIPENTSIFLKPTPFKLLQAKLQNIIGELIQGEKSAPQSMPAIRRLEMLSATV